MRVTFGMSTAVALVGPERRAEMKSAFEMFDADGGGTVSSEEIAEVFESLGVELLPEELAGFIATVDADGSGEVDFCEFCELMEVVQHSRTATAVRGGVRRVS